MTQLLSIDDRWSFLTHKSVILENRALRIVVLPELGGRIWSVIYKALDRETVWQNPRIAPQKVPFGAAFDNFWCGGWEELFPTAAAATINGEAYPDHGEIWSLAWTPSLERGVDFVALRLSCRAPISGMAVEKTLTLHGDKSSFELSYRIENLGQEEFPFLFALHPAMAVAEGDRIDFPEMEFEIDPSYPGTLADVEGPIQWPTAQDKNGETDLRAVKAASSKAVYFLYGHGHRKGWFAVTDPVNKFSAGLTFSPEVFRSCWVFASYGGWRGYHTAMIEPCTSYPQQLEDAISQGRAATLAPGKTLQTTVTFLCQEGLSSVGGITDNGQFRE